MKKYYVEPEIEVVEFDTKDIVTTSEWWDGEFETGSDIDDIVP